MLVHAACSLGTGHLAQIGEAVVFRLRLLMALRQDRVASVLKQVRVLAVHAGDDVDCCHIE